MKFTLFVVALIAVATVAHGANLRRAESEMSVSAQKKMMGKILIKPLIF